MWRPLLVVWGALWGNRNSPSWRHKSPWSRAGFAITLVCDLRQIAFPFLTKCSTGFSGVLRESHEVRPTAELGKKLKTAPHNMRNYGKTHDNLGALTSQLW